MSVSQRIHRDLHLFNKFQSGEFPVNPFNEPGLINTLGNVRIEFLPQEIVGEPEVVAMLGAFYSRSPKPIKERLAELGDVAAIKEKLHNIVIGYGHQSVLDMVDVSIFIERVPILAAVAIENHALFAGQEVSTRYVDWSQGEFVNPFSGRLRSDADRLYEQMRATYVTVQTKSVERLLQAHQQTLDGLPESDRVLHERAIRARSFDIARGFLPASAVTSLVWKGRLSSILQHLGALVIHWDPLITEIARKVYAALKGQFSVIAEIPFGYTEYATDYWPLPQQVTKMEPAEAITDPPIDGLNRSRNHDLFLAAQKLPYRLKGTRVPPRYRQVITLRGTLDYGSFRDLNRHRVGYKTLPAPDVLSVMHPWYTSMVLDFDLPSKDIEINTMNYRTFNTYTAPLGALVPIEYEVPLHQYYYLIELRSTPSVHPTLRQFVQQAHATIEHHWPKSSGIFVDMTPDPGPLGYVLNRGKDTIFVGGQAI